MTWWSQYEKHWLVWYMCAVHARSTDSVFGEVCSFVLSHGSYLTCRSHWLILPVMQSIPLAVNSVIELIRTFSALMESEWLSSSHLRHVFYPETIAFKWTTSQVMLPLVSGSHNWPIPLSSSGTELPLVVESYGLLNDIFPFPSILDAGYPIFNLHLANVLFDVFLPSILGSSLWSFG